MASRDVLRVEKGSPTPEELAALTAVLLSRTAAAENPGPAHPPASRARWQRPERTPRRPGPRSWLG
ncbi:acyl-CoA carboxylase subunit epsilon [Streptomyces xanthochromogenes]|uniref:acyl-CoA carboxylase subunit epsilon n=1 Tax=Streptomyces xanthochromogenes TaxID=67384 RepID=UPI00341E693D